MQTRRETPSPQVTAVEAPCTFSYTHKVVKEQCRAPAGMVEQILATETIHPWVCVQQGADKWRACLDVSVGTNRRAFSAPFGLPSVWDVRKVASSYLRQRNLLPFCDKSQIGDGQCQPLCNDAVTGYDGGDCINLGNASEMSRRRVFCKAHAGDGTCDGECNYAPFSYDSGDCCDETIVKTFKTCVDPSSKLLRWYTYDDFKAAVFQEGLQSNSRYIQFTAYRLMNR